MFTRMPLVSANATITVPPPLATSTERAPPHALPVASAPSHDSTWGGGFSAPPPSPPQTLPITSLPTQQDSPPPSPPPPPLDGSVDAHLFGRAAVAGGRLRSWHRTAPPPGGRSLQGGLYSSWQSYYPSPPSSPLPSSPPPSPPPLSSSLRRVSALFCNPCTGPISSAVLDYAEAMTGLLFLTFVACLLLTCHKLPSTSWLGTRLASMQRSSRGAGLAVPV